MLPYLITIKPWYIYRVVLRQVFSSSLFSSTTDLTDENDAFRFGIVEEDFKAVNEIGSVERITSDTNAECLT